ncbi:MAG TPA: hypothetical protein VLJ39_10650, partial [Tepidisphaeraceae bacterium]|nr:hypothetical protein [Tepidisphaeraceae bacterium]
MTNTADSYPAPGPHRRRARKWAALAFAASVASPVALSQYSRVYAGDQPADPAAGATRAHLTGKQLYDLGVAQYRRGEWDSARQNLRQAIAAGYKPTSFFQDSPAEILRRIDSREQSDRSKVQRLAQLSPAATAPANAAPDPLEALRATDEARKIRHEQAVTQANVWVKDALAARRANDNERALSLFTRAADLDPGNRAAVQGRDEVLVLLGRSPAPANLMQQEAADLEARRGEIRYRVQGNLDQARAAIAAHKWADAQIAIDRARLAASADPTIFQAQENQRFSTEIDRTELDFRKAQERVEADAQSRRDEAIQRRIQDERRRAIEERQRTIADLVHTAQLLSSEGRYAEALQTVDQILILDPINDYAVGVRPLLEDKSQFAEQRQYAELRDRKITDVLNAAEEAQVPYDDVLRYPTDWPDISDRRDRTVAAEGGASAVDRALQTSLDRKLPEVKFDGVALGDVIDFLRDVSGLNLFVNWKSLEAAGVDKNTPVTANLRDVKFSKALSVILSQSVGSGQTQLGYTVDQGVVTISTADDLSKNVQVRVYDIRDLILSVPNFNDAPQFSLDASQNGGGGGGGGGGAGGGGGGTGQTNTLFSGTGNTTAASTGPTRQDLVDAITKLVEDTVSSDSWKDNGGSTGALRELQGELIVTQTPENHRQVVALLEKLRETRALQISIEARFLIVQRNFMEDIGLDLNFLFNLNSSWSKNFGTIPLSTPSSTFTMNPTTGVQGSIGSGTTTPTGL